MIKLLPGLLLMVLPGCTADVQDVQDVQPQVDETKAAGVAQQALADWVEKKQDERKPGYQDIDQIQGATLESTSVEGGLIHVILVNDASEVDANGYLVDGGMHMAYFNVYLDLDYQVVKVERGPDMIE